MAVSGDTALIFLAILVMYLVRTESVTQREGITVTSPDIKTLFLPDVLSAQLTAAWFIALMSVSGIAVLPAITRAGVFCVKCREGGHI